MKINFLTLTEIKEDRKTLGDKNFVLKEIIINPQYIVMITGDTQLKNKLISFETWPTGLDKRVDFTRIHINTGSNHFSSNIIVVGNYVTILEKISEAQHGI